MEPLAPPALPFEVLYLDNHLLVVIKPAGLLVQADATGDPDLLTLGKAYLKGRFDKPGNVFLGLVHRLDRPVSGVMVLARTSKAAGRLSAQFRQRDPDKRYLALAEGRLEGAGEREDHLAKLDRTVRVVKPTHPEGKRAVLRWRALGQDRMQRKGLVTLVDVELVTGRAHQVRAQLAAMGHPLLGDLRYGARQEFDGRNLALHSYALTVEHPTRREPMTFTALPPPSWRDFFPALVHETVAGAAE
ncbi:MAG: RluA family pseudouridine synthase [Rhodothermales bacterium]|nr:RluA family pseudouridine synthase [Rhodothermales bacterium]